jgi:uncharacterized OB-fold protein
MWRGSPAVGRSRLDAKNAACHHCRRETNFGGRIVRLSDNDVMVAATLAAAVGQTMTSKSASDLVSALEEIIDELTRRGGTGAMCADAAKKYFPAQAAEHQHFPDR